MKVMDNIIKKIEEEIEKLEESQNKATDIRNVIGYVGVITGLQRAKEIIKEEQE